MEIKQGGVVSRLLADVPIPRMFRAEQLFPRERIAPADIPAAVAGELSGALPLKIRPGMSIAITAGSRGIANVDLITRSIADFVKARGAVPFIVPAMGSHGGATAEGQLEVLASYGITPEAMGCEIRSSMEVVELGTSDTGLPVYLDKTPMRPTVSSSPAASSPTTPSAAPTRAGPARCSPWAWASRRGPSGSTPTAWARSGPTSPPSPRSFWPGPPSSLPCPASRTPMTRPAASRPSTGTTFSPGSRSCSSLPLSGCPLLLVGLRRAGGGRDGQELLGHRRGPQHHRHLFHRVRPRRGGGAAHLLSRSERGQPRQRPGRGPGQRDHKAVL